MKKLLTIALTGVITLCGCSSYQTGIPDKQSLNETEKKGLSLTASQLQFDDQEIIGDVLISYGVISATGGQFRNRITFKTPYANTNYAVITSGEHSSESWYWEKYLDGFNIGTDESSRTLYYFVIGAKQGARNPNIDSLIQDNLKIEWGVNQVSGGGSTLDIYFDAPVFKQRPSLFVSAVHESHVSFWNPTNSKFQLVNMSSSNSRRELSWVAFGSRIDGNSVPYYTDSSSNLNIFSQRIGNSQLNFAEAYMGTNQTKTINMNRIYTHLPAAFGCREHGWKANPWHVSTSQYDIRNEDVSNFVSTFFIGKITQ